jgi:hypothetical protein
MTLEQKIKNRISGLKQYHSGAINQPEAIMRGETALLALEQIRVKAILIELYSLLEQECPDYPMCHRAGES